MKFWRLFWATYGALAALIAAAHASWETQGFSVHFTEYEPDFGAPTSPVWIKGWESWDGRSGFYYSSDTFYRFGRPHEESSLWTWQSARRNNQTRRERSAAAKARAAEKKGNWREAEASWRVVLGERGALAAIAQDRIEVFRQRTSETPKDLLKRYFALRDQEESSDFARLRMLYQSIERDPRAGFLQAHASYGIASISVPSHGAGGEALYAQTAARYPNSPRRESALIMAARCALMSPLTPASKVGSGRAESATVRTANAKRWLQTLLRDYPATRFRPNALGWLARAEYLSGNRKAAIDLYRKQIAVTRGTERFQAWQSLAINESDFGGKFVAYLRMLADADDPMQLYWANVYLARTKEDLTNEQAASVSRLVANDPTLLDPYLDYRLRHTSTTKPERIRLANLAESAIRRYPQAKIRPRLLARLAEIEYRRGRYGRALQWASRAIDAGDGPDGLAHYMAASCRFRLGDMRGAERGYAEVRRKFPKSHLAKAAREPLAIVNERQGDLAGALDLYFDLQYESDIAYMLDARMSPEQVRAYGSTQEGRKRRHRVSLALGYRLLRVGRFDEAERAFLSIPEGVRKDLVPGPGRYGYTPFDTSSGAEVDRMFDPVKTTRDLRRLSRAVASASGGEPKAKAMFALANYYRDRRHLLLYNASLWQGTRLYDFGWFWFKDIATKSDEAAVQRHHREHECLMHTYRICIEIAEKYPTSSVAPQALYRAAASAYTLSEFNDWWRKQGRAILTGRTAARLMGRMAARYPNHALAKNARKYSKLWTLESERRELRVRLEGIESGR